MYRFLKLLGVVFVLSIAAILILNVFDAPKSQNLEAFEDQKEQHKKVNNTFTSNDLAKEVATRFELKTLRADLRNPPLKCFVKSTCSDKDYNRATEVARDLIKEHHETLINFQNILNTKKPVSLPANSAMDDNTFFSLNSIIQLSLVDINYLFSKANSDLKYSEEAIEKALALDDFIQKSISLPNISPTSVILLANLKSLRSSLQKYSPRSITLSKVSFDKINKMIQVGEFITFSNSLEKLIKTETSKKYSGVIGEKVPSVFISRNRTLNLYVKLSSNYAQSDCIQSEKTKFCTEIPVTKFHPINPIGRILAPLAVISPMTFKKVFKLSKEINALNL